MRHANRRTAGLVTAAWLAVAGASLGAEPKIPPGWENLQAFYDAHEECRDFMPFGLFGYGGGSKFAAVHAASGQFNSDQVTAEMHFDSLVDHNFNSIWGGLAIDPSPSPKLGETDDFFYGTLLPRYEMRTLPSCSLAGFNTTSATFAGMQRRGPMLTAEETARAEQALAPRLAFLADMVARYPRQILGFVTDDEPENVATAVAAARLVEKHTGRLATFTTPNFYNVQTAYADTMMPITGDLYYCSDNARSSWMIPEQVRWLAKNKPGRLFWLMPLTCSWTVHEPTLPDLPDSRTLRSELRLQCWSALALGTKGFYFFQQGEWCFSWGEAQDGVFDVVKRENDHHARQNLAAELREIGRDFTTIGPSLLTAYPALEPGIPIDCGKVRFPNFRGPAVDCGLLRDPRAGRDFLVPWNNDVDHEQAATLTVPAELLGPGRAVYDLHSLEPVALGPGGTLPVTLPPGGGRVYLLGDDAAFAAVQDDILRQRVRPERVKARVLVRRRAAWPKTLSFAKADELIVKARAAEKAADWRTAAAAYGDAVAEMRRQSPLAGIEAILEQAGGFLSQGDDLLRTHGQALFNIRSQSYRGYGHIDQMFGNLPIRQEIGQWVALAAAYVSMRQTLHSGNVNWDRLDKVKAAARRLAVDAEANVAALRGKFAQRIKDVRRPYRVAYVTSDRDGIEEIRTYAWAYRTFRVKWIAPDDSGMLRDMAGRDFDPAEYDVVWIHQLASRQPPTEEVRADPAAVLLESLLEPAMKDAIGGFVARGGGLLLTGVAGLYTLPLGVETVPPDRFQENGSGLVGFRQGIMPVAGVEKHPALAHLPPQGILTNGGGTLPGWCAVTECVWATRPPSGKVLAHLMGEKGERVPWAAIVEYPLQRGTIMVMGGMCCSLTPGLTGGGPDVPRQMTLDAIGYLAEPERFAVPRGRGK
jgi:hypothetical protein